MSVYNLSERSQRRLESVLRPDESVIWASKPNADDFSTCGSRHWTFHAPLLACASYWASGTSPSGLPFVLIALVGLACLGWLRHRAGSTLYAITSQRVIVIEGARSLAVRSYGASDLLDLERVDRRGGCGDLILGTEHYVDSRGIRHSKQYGFFAVDEVRCVERLVANMRERH